MNTPRTFSLTLQKGIGGTTTIESSGTVVVVGANGSGKTKLGTWIENSSALKGRVHRISAQKSLQMPNIARPSSMIAARNDLLYGHEEANWGHRKTNRWRDQPETYLLDDFERLMVYLFTDHFEQSTEYKERAAASKERISPPITKLDYLICIWEEVLPHRKLKIKSSTVEVYSAASSPYKASDMSDGERVIFYLIGQALAVPENGIMVIDEPELHLHKSIQSVLWDRIEAQRPDCLFVYLTHDLEFAASRVSATKICLREYNSKVGFDWFQVPINTDIPEEMFLKIIGSRKPVLFVEGEKTSLDYFVFQQLFSKHTVVPRGSCDQVIQSTMSFNGASNLHFINASGIIDRDRRSSEELEFLKKNQRVFPLEVSEVENLFLTSDALGAIAAALKFENATAVLEKIKSAIILQMENDKQRIISGLTAGEIERKLKKFDGKALGESQLRAALGNLTGAIDVEKIYAEQQAKVERVLQSQNYDEAIKIYSNKGLIAQAALCFGLNRESFIALVKRLMLKDDVNLIPSIKQFVPDIS